MKAIWLSTVLVLSTVPLGAAAQSDSEGLAELKRIIEQQQKMIEAQSRALKSLTTKVEALTAKRQEQQDVAQPVTKIEALSAQNQAEQDTPAIPTKIEKLLTKSKGDEVAPSTDKLVASGEDNIALSLSGQVNRGILIYDDGTESDTFHVDNANSSTRFRMIGTGKITSDITLGAQIEVQMQSNSTTRVSQISGNDIGGLSFTERKLEIYFDSKRLGRVWLGQGDTASNGTSEFDLSGTSVINYSSVADMAGGLFFRDNTPIETTDPQIKDVFSNLDGLSRDDRIRYDTPEFAGFTASTSHISGGGWDVALRYAANYESVGIKTAGAIGYADASDIKNPDFGVRSAAGFLTSDGSDSSKFDTQLAGSVSLLHRSGINGTLATGTRKLEIAGRDDVTYIYGKIGYVANLIAFGKTAFSIDYIKADDVAATGDEATAYGFFAVQKLPKFGTEIYGGIRNHELDRPGGNFDDVQAVLLGTRVKF
jgi:uncharacterized coiled-coil protein SlyX